MKQIQVIFQSHNGVNGAKLDYCREQAPTQDRNVAEAWARDWCNTLTKRERCEFSYRIEIWN